MRFPFKDVAWAGYSIPAGIGKCHAAELMAKAVEAQDDLLNEITLPIQGYGESQLQLGLAATLRVRNMFDRSIGSSYGRMQWIIDHEADPVPPKRAKTKANWKKEGF